MTDAMRSKRSASVTKRSDIENLIASFTLKDEKSESAYRQVQEFFRQLVMDGSLKRGQRLPPLRKICEELNVSYVTAARGIRALVEEGILEARAGAGTRVASIRQPATGGLGIIGFEPFESLLRHTRYAATILPLVQDHINARKHTVVYQHWSPQVPMHQMFNNLSMVDGLLIIGCEREHAKQIKSVINTGKPVIVVGQRLTDPDIPCIASDNAGDVTRAVQWLFKHDHRRIAILTDPPQSCKVPIAVRTDAAMLAMQKLGIHQPQDWAVHGNADEQIARLRKLKPTAVLVLTDPKILHAHRQTLASHHLTLGSELFPAVYDENLWNLLTPLGIPLLDIRQPVARIAQDAVDWLIGSISQGEDPQGMRQLPSTLKPVNLSE